MSILLFPLISLTVIGLFTLFRAVFLAPLGEEDSQGFRFTEPQNHPEVEQSSRVPTAAEFAFFRS